MSSLPGTGELIVRDELDQLSRVRTLLEEEPYVLPPREADVVAELVRIREELPSAKEEDKPALLQQYDHLRALLDQLRESRAQPQVDPDSPYFAHMRVEEDGEQRDIFLGKATRISRGIRIVDWRHAPVSRLFYAYRQGDDYEEQLGDQPHSGEIVARRTVSISRGILSRIEAPEGIFFRDPGEEERWTKADGFSPRLSGGERAALRAYAIGAGTERKLGSDGARSRADKHLPDIAALIDAEQFALITRPSSGYVVVRGTAGSGKTTVALHRIAWLAYSDPLVDSERTLVLVLSPALKEYVSHVLPALGLKRVAIRDFRMWASDQRFKHFPKLPRKTRHDTPALVVKLKSHPAAQRALEAQVARHKGPATPEQAFDDLSSALTDRDLLSAILSEIDRDAFREEEIARFVTWCRDKFDEIERAAEGDTKGESPGALDAEDDILLLYAWQLRVGPLRHKGMPLRYRHIAIDEVQDFSALEIRVVIGCLDDHKSLTMAGDTQQHVTAGSGFTSWSDFLSQLGLQGAVVSTLKIAYRCSEPVVAFSRALLGELAEDDSPPLVTRNGPPVELFRFTDTGAAVAFLADALTDLLRNEPSASVVLLVPSQDVAMAYESGLRKADLPKLKRITSYEFSFAPGVEIAEIASVKGLEFDYVVLLEVSAAYYPDTAAARRLLHVGATRAIHQLWLVSTGSLSPILEGLSL